MKFKYLLFVHLLLINALFAQSDLSLSDAITQALTNNYDVRISKLDQKAASIMNSWGVAGGLPSLDFSLSGTRTQDMDEEVYSDRYSGGLTLNWLLFDGFAVHIQKSKFAKLEELSEGNTALLIEQTIQSVILAYYNVLLQQKTRDVYDTLRILSKDRFDRADEQRRLGTYVTYDVLQAKNAWLDDQTRYLQQIELARNAVRELNYLMGVTEDLSYHLIDPFKADLKVFQYEKMFDKLNADNQMLKNKYMQQTLLEKDVALKRSDWSPSVNLRAGLDRTLSEGEVAATNKTYDAYGSLSLSWNLFSGGARLRAIQVAKLDREIGEVEIRSMKHTLANRLASQLETYNIRKELVNVADESLKTAELNLQISREKFETGAINSFNYRDVQLIYLNSALSRLQSVYNLLGTETELLRMTGGILSSYVK